MTSIELRGLRAETPIGAMAAFGVLRICQRIAELRGSKLGWKTGGGGNFAVLWTPDDVTPDGLLEALLADVKSMVTRQELHEDQIKSQLHGEFRAHAEAALTGGTWETASWFAAFGSELIYGDDDKIDATPFDMTGGPQKFLAEARKLAAALGEDKARRRGKSTADSYREAMFGPWLYKDDQHSLGWDPSTIKLGAFTNDAPTSMKNAGVRVAVWLAFESLPLFPCFVDERGKLQIRGFRRGRRQHTLYWPVWRPAISLDMLQTLLAWEGMQDEVIAADELEARGVAAIYRSERFKLNKYFSSFRAAELAAGAVV